jgi:hypothetical protein
MKGVLARFTPKARDALGSAVQGYAEPKVHFFEDTYALTRQMEADMQMALRGIVGTNNGPIRMLEPEKDFPDRQFVRFEGMHTVPDLPVPFLDERGKRRVFEGATAQPYGGATAEMTWKSRLTERRPE